MAAAEAAWKVIQTKKKNKQTKLGCPRLVYICTCTLEDSIFFLLENVISFFGMVSYIMHIAQWNPERPHGEIPHSLYSAQGFQRPL